jgi:hypothetical protein
LSSQSPWLSRESTRLHIQLYQTLPQRSKTAHHTIHHHPYKNFFENVFPQAVQDQSGAMRSSILKIFEIEDLSTDLTRLIQYINRRYPRINTAKRQETSRVMTATTTKLALQRENSKTNVHTIFNLFDPDPRPKAVLPKPIITTSNVKTPITFRRLGTKLTVLAAISRPQTSNKRSRSITTTDNK